MEILKNLLGSGTNATVGLTVIVTWVLVQVIKPVVKNQKYLPLVSAVAGGVAGLVVAMQSKDASLLLSDTVLGIVAGFAATGVNETFTKSFNEVIGTTTQKIAGSVNDSAETKKETPTQNK
ncbi:holin [Liquorilactobacillus satsumensis]|uniref:holin n=1 Tax=Liquorilactobacillus satsumensis TaxID=259059 RepID=UPI00345DBA0F